MKNLYFKIFTTLGLLLCFSANVIFAAQIAKSKIYLSESKTSAEKSLDVEEKASTFNTFDLKTQSFTTYIPAGLKLYSLKFILPSSYQSIPDRPPKG